MSMLCGSEHVTSNSDPALPTSCVQKRTLKDAFHGLLGSLQAMWKWSTWPPGSSLQPELFARVVSLYVGCCGAEHDVYRDSSSNLLLVARGVWIQELKSLVPLHKKNLALHRRVGAHGSKLYAQDISSLVSDHSPLLLLGDAAIKSYRVSDLSHFGHVFRISLTRLLKLGISRLLCIIRFWSCTPKCGERLSTCEVGKDL